MRRDTHETPIPIHTNIKPTLNDYGACELCPLRLLLDYVLVPGPESGFGLERHMSNLRIYFHDVDGGCILNLSVPKNQRSLAS